MNPTTKHSLSLVAAKQVQTPIAVQDLFSLAMDQALGVEQASLDAVVCATSCAIDVYKNAFCLNPVVRELFSATAQALASCLEMQRNWLTMLAPYAASYPANTSQPASKELEHSMDLALGTPAASGPEPSTNRVVVEQCMDIAIGASAA